MKSLEQLQEQKKKLKAKLKKVQQQIDRHLSMTVVHCPNSKCGKAYAIGQLIFIRMHWYVEPSGCSGGDYWRPDEGQWECRQCKTRTRMYDKPELDELEPYFQQTVKEYR